MKKIFIVLFLIIAQTLLFCNSLDFLIDREYAYYYDNRDKTPFYRGYLYIKDDKGHEYVFCRNINLTNHEESLISVTVAYDQNGYPDIGGLQVISGKIDEKNPQFMVSVTDFLNFTRLYINNKNKIGMYNEITDDWDNSVYSFSPCLPFFAFREMKNNNKRLYSLDQSGIITSSVDSFTKCAPKNIHEVIRSQKPLYIPLKTKPKNVLINGIKVTIDNLWKENNSAGSPGYWLSLYSTRDSQLMIEKIPRANIVKTGGSALNVTKYNLLVNGPFIDFTSLVINTSGDLFTIDYDLYDSNMYKNHQKTKSIDKKDCSYFLNFSTFSDIYENNLLYYSKIIASIKL